MNATMILILIDSETQWYSDIKEILPYYYVSCHYRKSHPKVVKCYCFQNNIKLQWAIRDRIIIWCAWNQEIFYETILRKSNDFLTRLKKRTSQ